MSNIFELMATLHSPEQQQLLRDIVGDIDPPSGYVSWKEAAVDERGKRVAAEQRIKDLEVEIKPLRARAQIAEERTLREQKLEQIVDILFNQTVSGDLHNRNLKCRHPEKFWWWNGASIIDSDYNEYSGSFEVTVDSYVGGGETEEYTMNIPKEWLDTEDPTALIDAWAAGITNARLERERLEKLKRAQYDMQRAQQQIEALSQTVQELQST